MNIEDLPADMQEEINMLKHGSLTIQTDIEEALNEAEDLEHLKDIVDSKMQALIEEAQSMRTTLGAGKTVIVHG